MSRSPPARGSWARRALHQFVRIGTGAVVGGVAGVERDVIPYGSVLGNRARLVGLNWVGLKRSGMSADELQQLRLAFRTLFPRAGSSEAFGLRVERVRQGWGHDARVATILEFIDHCGKRGPGAGGQPRRRRRSRRLIPSAPSRGRWASWPAAARCRPASPRRRSGSAGACSWWGSPILPSPT